jgi:precorrin-6Y C5,15-methyltransferase (decarboxylating)
MPDDATPIAVVGLIGGTAFGDAAQAAIEDADVVVGSARQLDLASVPTHCERIDFAGPLDDLFDRVAAHRDRGRRVCVLASGDPGFFGIVRALGERFGPAALAVFPAPSSIAMAFARVGLPWDDAVVVSAHGRSLDAAIAVARPAEKVAVLTSPDKPPEAVGKALLLAGGDHREVAVVTRIGEDDESVTRCDLATLAGGAFDPMSVVIVTAPNRGSDHATLAWGLPEHCFVHRDGMITKAEVRAVALGKLALPSVGVFWDVGAGSGSVAVEAARLCPGLRVIAIESDEASVARIHDNVRDHGCAVDVVHGRAPEALGSLPDPDRVFVGGGGIDVLDAAIARLRDGGTVVANYALLDRAVAAWERLGNIVEISVSRGVGLGDHGVRLAAENPVFVCWGPRPESRR